MWQSKHSKVDVNLVQHWGACYFHHAKQQVWLGFGFGWLDWELFACRPTSPSGGRATSETKSFIQSWHCPVKWDQWDCVLNDLGGASYKIRTGWCRLWPSLYDRLRPTFGWPTLASPTLANIGVLVFRPNHKEQEHFVLFLRNTIIKRKKNKEQRGGVPGSLHWREAWGDRIRHRTGWRPRRERGWWRGGAEGGGAKFRAFFFSFSTLGVRTEPPRGLGGVPRTRNPGSTWWCSTLASFDFGQLAGVGGGGGGRGLSHDFCHQKQHMCPWNCPRRTGATPRGETVFVQLEQTSITKLSRSRTSTHRIPPLASTTFTDSPSVSGHFTHYWDFHSVLRVVNLICRCTKLFNFWLVREFLVWFYTAKTDLWSVVFTHPSVIVDRRQL